jgi:hypothetical protein
LRTLSAKKWAAIKKQKTSGSQKATKVAKKAAPVKAAPAVAMPEAQKAEAPS